MDTISKKTISALLTSIMLILIPSEISLGQCTSNCVPLNETFGSTATCGTTQNTTNAGIVNHTNLPYNGGSNDYPNDGQYSIRCDGAQVNWGWFGAGGSTMSDHTADPAGQTGNYLLMNSIGGPTEYYHKTVTGLCANTTYNFTYYAGNLVRDDIYTNQPSLSAYTFPAGTAVQALYTFSGTGGTLLGSTGNIPSETSTNGFKWNAYSYNFTTGAGQTSIDIVLMSLFGNNAGFDFAIDDIRVTLPSCPTPLEFISFKAKCISDEVATLDWQITKSTNVSHFEVEQSMDGINFKNIGTVNAQRNSSQFQNYSFTVEKAFTHDKLLYYRLHTINLDGTSKYSKTISISSDAYFFEMYPNPLHSGEALHMSFHSLEKEEEFSVSVVDPMGNVVHSLKGKTNELIITDLISLDPGIYFVEIRTSNELKFEKLIIE